MVPFFVQFKCKLGQSYAVAECARRGRDRLEILASPIDSEMPETASPILVWASAAV